LHVLGTPPAFILSQDQTLHRNCRETFPCTFVLRQWLLDDLAGSSRSPPLFDCQRALRCATSWPESLTLVSAPTDYYIRLNRRVSRKALAPAYCPTQLPTQYRRRWSVSRPCSGWERVGPLRQRHQGLTLTPSPEALQLLRDLAASRTQQHHLRRVTCCAREDPGILALVTVLR
jgi:hypothetical protein